MANRKTLRERIEARVARKGDAVFLARAHKITCRMSEDVDFRSAGVICGLILT
jgi:hypothetical protein